MPHILTTNEGTARLEARPSGGAFLNTDTREGKAISLALTLDQLLALRIDIDHILHTQIESQR